MYLRFNGSNLCKLSSSLQACCVNSCPLKLKCTSKCPFVLDSVLCFLKCVCVFRKSPVNPFSPALSCGFSIELLLAYCALAGCHGNMVLCVLFTRASYRNKVPSTICTASALFSTLWGSSIGTVKFKTSRLLILTTFNHSCFCSVAIWPLQLVWLIEKEAAATSEVEVWQWQEAANGMHLAASTNWLCCCWVRFQSSTPSVFVCLFLLESCVKNVPYLLSITMSG